MNAARTACRTLAMMAMLAACAPSVPSPATVARTASPAAHAPMTPPFTVTLAGAAQGDVTEVHATLSLDAPLPAPLLITFDVPAKSSLVDGPPSETVAYPKRGQLTRIWRVRGALDPANPVVVTVQQQIPDRAGATARVVFPQAPTAAPPKFSAQPAAHVGGVPVRAAIEVDGKRETP